MSKREWLDEIQAQLGYAFKNEDLLQQAFVRKTYAMENGGADNEVLEFVGDRVLDIVVTKYLMGKYEYMTEQTEDYDEDEDCNEYYSELSEGELTELKKRLVQKRTLANRIDRFGWNEYLILGKGDEKNNIQDKDSVKEDLFEAIVGAVTIDSDWDFEEIEEVVMLMLDPDEEIEDEETVNYVSKVQEWYSSFYGETPKFRCRKNMGFEILNSIGNKRGLYLCELTLGPYDTKGDGFYTNLTYRHQAETFFGLGDSKSEARRDLCYKIYTHIQNNGLLISIKDEINNPNKNEAINQLETLARRGYFSIPIYSFKEAYDKDGNPIWSVKCQITEYSVAMTAKASSKKEAKKTAAFKMLKYVLKEED